MAARSGGRRRRIAGAFSEALIDQLCRHAAHAARLLAKDAQGVTRLERLKQFAQKSGIRHPDLTLPDLEPEAAHLIGWWRELDQGRTRSEWGAQPLTHHDIDAWQRLTGRRLTAWELAAVRRIDIATLNAYAEARRAAEPPKGKK